MIRVIGSWFVLGVILTFAFTAEPVNSETFNVEANFDLATLEPIT
jgi:hypothetical protein